MFHPRNWIRIFVFVSLSLSSFLLSPAPAAHADEFGVVEGIVQVEGVPLGGVEVFLGIGFGEGSEGRHVCTEADGTFRFEDVPLYTPLISATGVALALDCPNANFVMPDGRAGLIQYYDHVNMTEGYFDIFWLDTGSMYLTFDVLPWPSAGNTGIDNIPPRVYQEIHDGGLDDGVPQEARELLFHYMERVRTRLDQGKLTQAEAEQLLIYADFVLNMGFAPEVFYINPPFIWPRDGTAVVFAPPDTEVVLRTGWGACTRGLTQAYTQRSETLLTINGEPLVPDQAASTEYWGPIEPRYIGPENACVNGTDILYVAFWEYSLGVLEPGEYFVEFSWGLDQPFQDGGDYDGDGKPDMVMIGGETAFTILVIPTGGVSGFVYDDMGLPLEGIYVLACEYEGDEPYCDGAMTDSDGYYEIYGLPVGGYRVFTTPQGYWVEQFFDHTPMWEESAYLEVFPNDVTTGIDFHLTLGGSISGNVSELGGSALEGIDVVFCDWFVEYYCWGGPTDENGDYQSPALLPSQYRVFVYQQGEWVEQFFDQTPMWDEATPVEVFPMADMGGIDFYLEEGGAISGFVHEEGGGPLEGIDVIACDYVDDWLCWGALTGGDGYYSMAGLPPSSYRVFVYQQGDWVEQFYDHQMWWEDADEVYLSAGDELWDINFDLTLGGSISGQVTDPYGVGLEGIDVIACTVYDKCRGAMTGPEGFYTIMGVHDDTYKVLVYEQAGWQEQFYYMADWTTATEIIISGANHVGGIDFHLYPLP
jgi:hypothetical protein